MAGEVLAKAIKALLMSPGEMMLKSFLKRPAEPPESSMAQIADNFTGCFFNPVKTALGIAFPPPKQTIFFGWTDRFLLFLDIDICFFFDIKYFLL
jgi:hypothetical protein